MRSLLNLLCRYVIAIITYGTTRNLYPKPESLIIQGECAITFSKIFSKVTKMVRRPLGQALANSSRTDLDMAGQACYNIMRLRNYM